MSASLRFFVNCPRVVLHRPPTHMCRWVLYDDPTELKDTEFERYLRAMFLSREDCIGFCKAALSAPLPPEDGGYVCAYALSNNSESVFDLTESIEKLGYEPKDSADDFSWS